MTLTFPDVSHHQETIDWTKFPYDVVAIKATQGNNIVDSEFINNLNGSNKLPFRMLYHFMDSSDPVQQAQFFVRTVGSLNDDEGIMLDMEGLTVNWQDYYNAWSNYVKTTLDRTHIALYTNDNDYAKVNAGTDLRWVARYGSTPDNPATIWQYTDTGTVAGINGNVDLSSTGYTLTQLLTLLGAPPVVPPTQKVDSQVYVFHRQSPDLYILCCGGMTTIISHSSPTVGNLKANGAVFTVVDDDTYANMEKQARKASS